MKTLYFLAALYFAVSLFHAVNFDAKGVSFNEKVKNFFAAAFFPAWWVYSAVKGVYLSIKGK